MEKYNKKMLCIIIRVLISLAAFGAGGFLLYKYEYFAAAGEVDNVIGFIPVAFTIVFAGGVTALVWMKHSKRSLPLSVTLAALVALAAALFPNALRGNWWLNLRTSDIEAAQPDLSVFAPFSENSQTAKPDGPSTLTLSSGLPVLDGATALYPVYAAFAEAVYDADAYAGEVMFTNTRNAYKALTAGERDIIFVAGAADSQLAEAKAAGAELVFTPIGREAFVFLAGKSNPLDGLSVQQIRNIYSGKTARWSTLGWKEGGGIIAFQRPEGSGSQTGLQSVMKRLPIQAPQPLPDASLIGSNSLLNEVSLEWKGVQPALGYSYRYYAVALYPNPGLKLLEINGVPPTPENIRNGTYPFVSDFYAVTNGAPAGNAKALINWILSAQGQELIEKTGYTPIK